VEVRVSETGSPPSDNGKLWAALSYGGFFFGLPVGIVPLLQRDDPYALKHAKTATAVWLGVFILSMVLTLIYTVLSFVTCGFGAILFPMLLLPLPWGMLVGIHGLLLSLNGSWDEPMGGFGLGEKLFATLTLKDGGSPPLFPPSKPPPPPQ
jgi:hypothetical protein